MKINIETKYAIGDEAYYLESVYEEKEIHTCWKCKGTGKLINIDKQPYICPFCNGDESVNDWESRKFYAIRKDIVKTIMLEYCTDSKLYSISYRTENGEYFKEEEIITNGEDIFLLQYNKNLKLGWTVKEIDKIRENINFKNGSITSL